MNIVKTQNIERERRLKTAFGCVLRSLSVFNRIQNNLLFGDNQSMVTAHSTFTIAESRFVSAFSDLVRGLSQSRLDSFLGNLLGRQTFEFMQIDDGSELGEEFSVNAILQSKMQLYLTVRFNTRMEDNIDFFDQYSKLLSRETDRVFLFLLIVPFNCWKEHPSGDRFAIASFEMVDRAIDEMLEDSVDVVSETEAKLLRRVKSLIRTENLSSMRDLVDSDKVAIVTGRGYLEYQCFNVLLCKSSNPFRQFSRLGYYVDDQIQKELPKILEIFDNVEMRRGANSGKIGQLVNDLIDWEDEGLDIAEAMGRRCSLILLSDSDSPDTFYLPEVIPNDIETDFGTPQEFTVSHRIVPWELLKKAKSTSDLV